MAFSGFGLFNLPSNSFRLSAHGFSKMGARMGGEVIPGVCSYALLVLMFNGNFGYSVPISPLVVLEACEGVQVVSLPVLEFCASGAATYLPGWGVKGV